MTTMLSKLRESQCHSGLSGRKRGTENWVNCPWPTVNSTALYKGTSMDITDGPTKEFPVGEGVASTVRVMPRETKVLCAPPCMPCPVCLLCLTGLH